MEKPAYFLGDAHLGVEPPGAVPHREKLLIDLLESWKGKASHVVILGDLFEFWYEYRYYVSKEHFALFRSLAELVESGVQVHLLRGNHDFAYGRFFPDNLGVKVSTNLKLELQGQTIFFTHGDGVAPSDRNYRLYRKILNHPLNQWLFSQIHPDWGMALARFVGRNSRKSGENKEIKLEEYLAWAERVIKKNNSQVCIHGHHHIPGVWSVKSGLVASPGEWIKKLTYLRLEAGELSLEDFGKLG
jgi:UDP-2,3-diacylglucosamine hydrolase